MRTCLLRFAELENYYYKTCCKKNLLENKLVFERDLNKKKKKIFLCWDHLVKLENLRRNIWWTESQLRFPDKEKITGEIPTLSVKIINAYCKVLNNLGMKQWGNAGEKTWTSSYQDSSQHLFSVVESFSMGCWRTTAKVTRTAISSRGNLQ